MTRTPRTLRGPAPSTPRPARHFWLRAASLATMVAGLAGPLGAAAQSGPMVPTPAELAGRARVSSESSTEPGRITTPPDTAEPRPVPRRVLPPEDDVRLTVQRYELNPDAPAGLSREVVQALTQPHTGAGKTFADLADAAAAVTAYLQRELGHYLGYAYVPEQAPQDGIVRLHVLEGRLDQVETIVCPPDLPVDCSRIADYVHTLQPGDVLKVGDVERVVLLVNDLRGIAADFEFKPGSRPGTARLVVRPRALASTGGRVEYSNGNPPSLGSDRVTASLIHHGPFRRGDGMMASLVGSEGLAFGLLQYTSPVGHQGARVGLSATALDYRVDPRAYPLGLRGTATTVAGQGLYPVIRSRNENWFASITLEDKRYTDTQVLQTGHKRFRTWSLGVTGDLRDAWLGGGISAFEAQYTQGRAGYSRVPVADAPDATVRKLNWRASRLQNLLPGQLQAYAALRGQLAWNNLDTTEQFRAGGPDGVRAFPAGEGSGDQGAVLTLELRLLPPAEFTRPLGGQAMFSLFMDRAVVQPRQRTADATTAVLDPRQDYGGWGLGLTLNHPAGWDLRSSLATPTINQPKDADDRPGVRFSMYMGKQF